MSLRGLQRILTQFKKPRFPFYVLTGFILGSCLDWPGSRWDRFSCQRKGYTEYEGGFEIPFLHLPEHVPDHVPTVSDVQGTFQHKFDRLKDLLGKPAESLR